MNLKAPHKSQECLWLQGNTYTYLCTYRRVHNKHWKSIWFINLFILKNNNNPRNMLHHRKWCEAFKSLHTSEGVPGSIREPETEISYANAPSPDAEAAGKTRDWILFCVVMCRSAFCWCVLFTQFSRAIKFKSRRASFIWWINRCVKVWWRGNRGANKRKK